ncbi:hypothetical protein MAR_017872 [Mya arenaria]|uniref:Uncharacterized protein n=1 Tax=Mya arenaria TaxID=6604 RepID=A0ABY7EFQ5_MYAAR|nr:hypothetical protein MAR_017872 [Mya arenaria]
MGNIVTKHSEESKELGAVTVDMSNDIAPNQVTKPDIGEGKKTMADPLRTYVRPLVESEFKRFKETNPAQQFSNYQKTYTPTKQKMNYTNINNNAQQLNDNGKPDWAKFDFHVKDYVDFSKLFLQTYMVHYTDFDNTCDQSALLAIIKKMHSFPKPIKTVTENLGTAVRNPWAHVDFKEWDTVKYQTCF